MGDFMNKAALKIKELYNLGLARHEKKIVQDVLYSINFSEQIINIRPSECSKIAFIVPGIDRYSGGITSVLRMGTYLVEFGYDITYLDFTKQKIKTLCENAKSNLPNYRGKITSFNKMHTDDFDVVIACNWHAAYYVNHFNAYKMYFVQDFEPYFFKLDERYLLAKLAYALGFHIVSLGKWNVEQIQKECKTSSILDVLDFPYEPGEYFCEASRNYTLLSKKHTITLAVYTKEEGKRIPNILQSLLDMTKSALKDRRNIDLNVKFFGLKKSYKTSIGKNLGKLNRCELLKLYQESDFGMVASMTNISLVPYEMLAAGLPIIEFKNGSYSTFLSEDTALLIDFDYRNLVYGLLEAIDNPQIVEDRMKLAFEAISSLSWRNTARQFHNILQELKENI
jgi:O-antigen biosynthesis protein